MSDEPVPSLPYKDFVIDPAPYQLTDTGEWKVHINKCLIQIIYILEKGADVDKGTKDNLIEFCSKLPTESSSYGKKLLRLLRENEPNS